MDVDQYKPTMEALATTPEFLSAFDYFWEQLNKQGEVNVFQAALFMFSIGYESCREFLEREKKFRSFKYDPKECN